MAVITDNINIDEEGLTASVVSVSDYYPFGLNMPGRTFSSDIYRYGFNGKEKDSNGEWGQTHYDYGFRIYNPQIGKFLSVDPLKREYPWFSPYHFAGNSPITYIDIDGLEPTKPKLYWNGDPKIELSLYKKDIERTIIYQTVGIHSNDRYFQNAHTMYVAHTYGTSIDGYDHIEKYYYYDNGLSKWIKFNPNDIGMSAEEVTNVAIYAIGGTGAVVGGLLILESGAVYTAVREGAKRIFVNSWKDMLARSSMDAINQFIIQGGDFEKIDWANVAASGLIKEKHLKNIVASALDYTIEEGKLKDKDPIDATVEFMIRTGADALFDKYKSPNSEDWNEKMGTDLLKKVMRKQVKEVYQEYFGETEATPEN